MTPAALALRRIAWAAACVMLLAATATAQGEVRVVTSGAFTAAYLELVPLFEQTAKQTVVTAFGASMGSAPDSIPSRLERGESIDVVILAALQLDALIAQGKVAARAKSPDAAKALIAFLASRSAVAAITRSGLEPVGGHVSAK